MTQKETTNQIFSSLHRTRDIIRDSIAQSEAQYENLNDQTENLRKILGMHDDVKTKASKGKSLIKLLQSKQFVDKYLYNIVFILYLIIVVYVLT